MELQNKILTVYSAGHTPENPKTGDILLQSGTSPYKIYDGTTWQNQANTNSAELREIFSKDENYFYVNYSTEPDIEFVKKWDGTQWNDITSSRVGQLLKAAADVEATADGKIKSYSGDFNNKRNEIAPNPDEGDLFIDTKHQNKLYRYSTKLSSNGQPTGWEPVDDERLVGEGDGISFTPYGGGYNAAVILNKEDGLKIINNSRAYFQATANKLGFYDSDDTPLMYISGGDAYFSGTIRAANIPTNGTGRITFGGVSGSGFYADSSQNMHVKDLIIDNGCSIGEDMRINNNYITCDPKPFTKDTFIRDCVLGIRMGSNSIGISLMSDYAETGTNISSFFGMTQQENNGHVLSIAGDKFEEPAFYVSSKDGITSAKFSDAVYQQIAEHIGGGGGGSSISVSAADYVSDPNNSVAMGSITINGRTTYYRVPYATYSDYGMVKYDNNTIKKNSGGQLYVASGGGGSSYTLPTASSSTKGGIKVGSGLAMSGETLYVTSVPTTNVRVEYGTINFSSEDTTVSFTNSFSSTPTVTVTLVKAESVNIGYSVHGRTTSGFQLSKKGDTSSRSFCWIAVGT